MSDRVLIANKIQTPDGTILHSKNRHDFVQHLDANGKTYFVDGGNDYQRLGGDMEDCKNLSVYSDDSLEKIREVLTWGTYGKNGDQPLKRVFLKDMDTDHIEAILETQSHISEHLRNIFKEELEFRK